MPPAPMFAKASSGWLRMRPTWKLLRSKLLSSAHSGGTGNATSSTRWGHALLVADRAGGERLHRLVRVQVPAPDLRGKFM